MKNKLLQSAAQIAYVPAIAGVAIGVYTANLLEGLKIFGLWFIGSAILTGVLALANKRS